MSNELREAATFAFHREIYRVICEVHAQHGDDLCWLDIDKIFAAAGLSVPDRSVGDPVAMHANCWRFITQLCTGKKDWPSYTQLEARIKELERFEKLANQYLDKTADGAFVVECEKLYCPKCKGETEGGDSFLTYCWNCPNPDAEGSIPLPLSYSSCLSKP